MTSAFDDRWGVPVQAADGAAVVLLDQAIEDLVALAGDPVGGAEAAIAADGELALARIFRAYLSLYGTTAEGAAEASTLIKPLEAASRAACPRASGITWPRPGPGPTATGRRPPAPWSAPW